MYIFFKVKEYAAPERYKIKERVLHLKQQNKNNKDQNFA